MNFETPLNFAQEKVQGWQRQADLERQVKEAYRFNFKLPSLHLPRLSRSARKPA